MNECNFNRGNPDWQSNFGVMLIAINHPYSEERLVNFGLITNAINLSAHILTADTTQFMILGMVYYVFYCFTDIIFFYLFWYTSVCVKWSIVRKEWYSPFQWNLIVFTMEMNLCFSYRVRTMILQPPFHHQTAWSWKFHHRFKSVVVRNWVLTQCSGDIMLQTSATNM